MDYFSVRYTIINLEIINGVLEITDEMTTFFLASAVTNFEERLASNLHYLPYIKKASPSFICISFREKQDLSILFQNCSISYVLDIENRLNSMRSQLEYRDIVSR